MTLEGVRAMAKWQFRKSKKIFPGVRMNISGKGIGFSVGGPGGRVSLSPNKKRITVTQSIPGTGLRKSQVYSVNKLRAEKDSYQNVSSSDQMKLNDYKTSEFKDIYKNIKTSRYIFIKRFFLTNFFSMLFIAFFVHDEKSPLGYVAAINFFAILISMPIYFKMRSKNLKQAREQYQLSLVQEEAESLKLENSEYGRAPRSLEEKQQVLSEYEKILKFSEMSSSNQTDNSISPEFDVHNEEIVFLSTSGGLTNYDGQKISDEGRIYVTNKRVSFHGLRKNVDWEFSKMEAPVVIDERKIAVFQVNDRKTVTGVHIADNEWFKFHFNLVSAFACHKYPERMAKEMAESVAKYRDAQIEN